ncbi:TonB-dependent receptor [Maribacter confluentis]|uniref:TonB-dependent receptor n=1 Tax=Maribacter confluentis TaxID=1656093 RepID=A0ABT8RKN3_9FLAO|nr:TonB-dependent receptor [Maribacter confluentis]MDO1511350.1 TonB-dependent receptor [Maribacter confluentis]
MNGLKKLIWVICLGLGSTLWAQDQLSGVVNDETGTPLPGVNIMVKGTSNGTVTDFDGNYQIRVSKGETLVFSYLGFKGQEIIYQDQTTIDVILVEDTAKLDEVVVIGYGSVKKTDLTGAVASIGAEELTEQRRTDLGQAVRGTVAGVDVRRLNSKPGSPLSIRVRGNTVITNSNQANADGQSDDVTADLSRPLYVVDGIFLDNINILNPADIQQMDILKDASATAIYGSRGANGVVIITTKNGIEGKTQFSYDASFGVSSASNLVDIMSGDEYIEFIDDNLRAQQWKAEWLNSSTPDPTPADFDNYTINRSQSFFDNGETDNIANRNYFDWIDYITRTAVQSSHTVSMSGGQNGLVYNSSIGYLKDEGVVGNDQAYERYTASTSLSKKMNRFTIGLRAYLSYSEQEKGSRELFRSAYRLPVTADPFDDNGELILYPDNEDQRFVNPYYEVNGAWKNNQRILNVISNFYVQYEPSDWLKLKTTFSPNLSSTRNGEHRGLLTKSARNDPSRTRAYYGVDLRNSYTWDNTADFNFDITDKQKLGATLITSVYYNQLEGNNIETRNVPDFHGFYNTSAGTDVRQYSSYYEKETTASVAGRINYNVNDKYLFTFTGRYDGASKLAEGNKWNFFPSAAFAWRASEEQFLQNADWLTNLKFRISYGKSGNYNTVSPYRSFAFLNNSNYLFGDDLTNGNIVSGLSNPELTWEVSDEVNLGVDFGMLNNRVNFSLELYDKTTEGAIFSRNLLNVTGFSSAVGNFGSMNNRGIEFTLNTKNIQTEDFSWNTSLNFAKNKNEILKLEGDLDLQVFGRHSALIVGQPSDAIYSYEKDGIWQIDEAAEAAVYNAVPGEHKYVDQNNDGILDAANDKVVIGTTAPDWTGGMTNNFKYKNLDMSVMMYTRQGVFGHSEFHQHHDTNGETRFSKIDAAYWTPDSPNADNPLPGIGPTQGEYFFEDMSFVKIGNIGLGYSFPATLLDKFHMTSARLSIDVQNPFTFTDFQGPDPETGLQNSYDMSFQTRTTLIGLKVAF